MQQNAGKITASTTNINSNKTKPICVEARWQLFFEAREKQPVHSMARKTLGYPRKQQTKATILH
jgi:hypothetical protein